MKKLYFTLSDNADTKLITMELSGCMAWIEGEGLTEESSEDVQYTLTPVWMTDEEFEALPEANI